jgi:hypothetical protein
MGRKEFEAPRVLDPRMYNINPTGEEPLAVEVNYRRVSAIQGGS